MRRGECEEEGVRKRGGYGKKGGCEESVVCRGGGSMWVWRVYVCEGREYEWRVCVCVGVPVTEGYISVHPPDLGYGSLVQTKRNISCEVHQRLNISQPSLVTLQILTRLSVVYST